MSEESSTATLFELLGYAASPDTAHGALPSIDQRVEIFLHALYGDREFTAVERADARTRILDEIAAALLDAAPERPEHELADGAGQIAAGRGSAPTISSLSANRAPTRVLLRSLEILMRDVLQWLSGLLGDSSQLRLVAVPLVVLLVAAAAWSAAWFNAAHTLEKRLAAAFNGRPNVSYACGSRKTEGFPLKVEIHCLDSRATAVAQNGTYVVQAPEVVASATVLSPGTIAGEIASPVTIAEGGRTIAVADGDLSFDQTGVVAGRMKFTTTPDGLKRLAAALDGNAYGADRLAELSSTYLRGSNGTDNAASARDEPDFGGLPVLDAPVNVIDGNVTIGSVSVGHLPSLFGNEASQPDRKP